MFNPVTLRSISIIPTTCSSRYRPDVGHGYGYANLSIIVVGIPIHLFYHQTLLITSINYIVIALDNLQIIFKKYSNIYITLHIGIILCLL